MWRRVVASCVCLMACRYGFEENPVVDAHGAGDPTNDALGDSAIGSTGPVAKVRAGGDQTCAISSTGQLKCWGNNARGQLGTGNTQNLGDVPGELGAALPLVDVGGPVSDIALGYQHACALLADGSVKCWGYNLVGQLGRGDTVTRGDNANEMGTNLVVVPLGATATKLAMGTYHSCALLTGGSVKCWGFNGAGQLGQNDMNDRGDMVGEVAGLSAIALGATALDIGAGDGHVCALLTGGSVKCWGGNPQGQLGYGDTVSRGGKAGDMGALQAVSLGGTATQLAVGGFHACVVLTSGALKCWGRNAVGQLGVGDLLDRGDTANEMGANLPTVDLGGGTVMQLALGIRHSCALLSTGAVKCWGNNTRGQLGRGTTMDVGGVAGQMGAALTPIDLGGQVAVQITAGGQFGVAGGHTCALLTNGAVKCWGDNTSGQLGLGDTANRGDGPGEMGSTLPALSLGL